MTSHDPTSFQSVILKLQQFWAEQGCLIWQPYHTEVGAGTMNPATFLRVLGPEPWWVAYVEPSIRPADGRFAENPNRWQHYYQFQVIMKPDPGNPQDRYLESLVALGIDPHEHDIRFVEDNWEQPAIGAWGLGWEVWLDGQEITQFTYFQQAGGLTLDPVSVEITYGLERIVMALQGVDSFLDIRWDDHLTYGDVNKIPEVEACRYNFELADVDRLKVLQTVYQEEARAAVEAGLIFPAHDYILKSSHAFNVLDARGAVGVTERAALFGKMRGLAQRVAEAYVEDRRQLGFPWLDRWPKTSLAAPEDQAVDGPAPEGPADFLLEIGTEELPAGDLAAAVEQLTSTVPTALDAMRLGHGAVHITGTPRRLIVHVESLAPRQLDAVTTVKGPPADRAYDEAGEPTQAAQGFARGQGVSVDELEIRDLDGGRYVVAEVRQPGESADKVLSGLVPELLSDLRFEKTMRWDDSGVSFSRPIRNLLALHGSHVIPIRYADLTSGRRTFGLRMDGAGELPVEDAADYFKQVETQGVVVDADRRRELIWDRTLELAGEVGGQVEGDPDLLNEVTGLVEAPAVFRGAIPADYLELPRAVLVSVMKKHQRYFPVESDGKLMAYFIGVRNGREEKLEEVIRGNEAVVKARFADADYFVKHDLSQPLEAYLPRLDTLVFQSQLGSMLDKVKRIERLTGVIAERLGLDKAQSDAAQRAARLSKADLATQMVVEMTSLQGEMGRIYAQAAGESTAVAQAIFEHYLPRYAGDQLPSSLPGLTVGIADRLDSLSGLFAAGLEPTGGSDPYALRRAAIGLIQSLVAHEISFDLTWAIGQAAEGLPVEASPKALQECLDFMRGREESLLLSEGHRHDVVKAILREQWHDPAGAAQGVDQLGEWVEQDDWEATLQAYARCARITRSQPGDRQVDPKIFQDEAEKTLFGALRTAEDQERDPGSVDGFRTAFTPMISPINAFFEEVLVIAEDPKLQSNRLGLLDRVVALAAGVADFSQLEGF
ncbi:MAG: glycine--tRNA ligase subunit beta [Anaerolineales bacterium]